MSKNNLLQKHNFKFNHSYGQNFIFDRNLLRAIVNDAGVDNKTNVLEIGLGAGTLTDELCKTANFVLGYEIDTNLKQVLQETLSEHNNVEVVFGDIMKQNTTEIETKLNNQPYTIVANLPYYITTPIIFKFVDEAQFVQKMVLMVQKEVAERIVAKENTSDYGVLTATINAISDTKIARIVKRDMFMPAPNVDSAIIVIEFNKNKYDIKDVNLYKKVARSAFAMRRKTLQNNLKASFNLNSQTIDQIYEKLGIHKSARGESLSVQKLVDLSNELYLLNIR